MLPCLRHSKASTVLPHRHQNIGCHWLTPAEALNAEPLQAYLLDLGRPTCLAQNILTMAATQPETETS